MNKFEKDFKEWYLRDFINKPKSNVNDIRMVNFDLFNLLPFSMQWGVYLAFFDSVGIKINGFNSSLGTTTWVRTWIFYINNQEYQLVTDDSRNENDLSRQRQQAQEEAIKKAKLIYEQL